MEKFDIFRILAMKLEQNQTIKKLRVYGTVINWWCELKCDVCVYGKNITVIPQGVVRARVAESGAGEWTWLSAGRARRHSGDRWRCWFLWDKGHRHETSV